MRKYLCWLLGHSYICLFRYHWGIEDRTEGSETTGWVCQHCEEKRFEQWDTKKKLLTSPAGYVKI